MTVVLVAGARGVVGSRIVELLRRDLPDVHLIPGSRRGRVSLGAGARVIDIQDERSIKSALDGVGVLVNAVGPYRYDPGPVIRACCATGVHYVDLAEFPEFIKRSQDASLGIEGSKSCILSGCSTSPGLLELLSQWAVKQRVQSIDAWLSLGTRNPVSAALLYGLLRPVGKTCPSGTIAFGELIIHRNELGKSSSYGRYPLPCEGELIEVGAQKIPVRFFVGFDSHLWTRLLVASSSIISTTSDNVLATVSRLLSPVAGLLRFFGSRSGELNLEAADEMGRIASCLRVSIHKNGMDIPTIPIVWVVSELHRTGDLPKGIVRLIDLVSFESAVEGLQKIGCEVMVSP